MTESRLDRLEDRAGVLLAREDHGRDLVALRAAYAADNPLGFDLPRFLRDELQLQTYPKLDEVGTAIVQHPYVAAPEANATGKTHYVAHVAVACAAMGWLVVCTSTGERQLKEQLMGRAFGAWRRAKLPGEFHELRWRLDRGEDSGIIALASDSVSRYGGYHSAVGILVVVDEAQGVEVPAWEGLRSSLMGAGRRRWVAVGNPLFRDGRFAEVCRMPHWHVVRIAATDVPNVSEGRSVIPGLIDGQAVEDTVREYGANSNYVRSRVHAEFPTQNEEGLFDERWLTAAAQRWATEPHPNHETETLLSVDPARFGADETAVCVRRGNHVLAFAAWHHADTMETVGRLRVLGEQYGVTPHQTFGSVNKLIRAKGRIVCDAVGIGSGVLDRLKETGYAVEEYNSGFKPTVELPGVAFLNRRAQSYWYLRDQLERGQLALPDDPKLFDELTQIKWRPSSTGKIQLESKDELRLRLGRSPDRADALAMALSADTGYSIGGMLGVTI